MKRVSLIIVFVSLLFTAKIFAVHSIQFTSPTNNSVFVASTSTNTAAVNFGFYADGLLPGYLYYNKLHTHTNIYNDRPGNEIPQWYYLSQGSYTWTIELIQVDQNGQETVKASQTIIFYVKYTIYAVNNFPGGVINLEGNQVNVDGTQNKVLKLPNESVSVSSIEQSDGVYWRLWNTSGTNNSNWKKGSNNIYNATSSSLSYTVGSSDNGVTLSSDMKKECSLTFQNSNGSMYVAGNTYSSSATVGVVEQNSITAYGNTYVNNGIEYRFTNWSKGGSTYGQTITPSEHGEYTANYDNGRPVYVNFYFGGVVGDPVRVIWTDNPNTAVTQYYIYRREKINGVFTSPQLVGNVGRSVGYCEDAAYTLAQAKNGTWLEYSVEAYYSTEGTYSDRGWCIAYGNVSLEKKNSDLAKNEVPTEYSIGNYPNPFNPTTTINYQLPKDGMVTIKVYDIIGKEVATLVNEQKSAGYYKVDFDASKLTSGVYIAAIQASGFNKSIKLLLTK